jgi:hypothetical protein
LFRLLWFREAELMRAFTSEQLSVLAVLAILNFRWGTLTYRFFLDRLPNRFKHWQWSALVYRYRQKNWRWCALAITAKRFTNKQRYQSCLNSD